MKRPVEEFKEYVTNLTAGELAQMGGVNCPTELCDQWLTAIQDGWLEGIEAYDDTTRMIQELGQDAVPVSTWQMFHVWADLALWQLETGDDTQAVPMEEQVREALYLVANRILCCIDDLYEVAVHEELSAGPDELSDPDMWKRVPDDGDE